MAKIKKDQEQPTADQLLTILGGGGDGQDQQEYRDSTVYEPHVINVSQRFVAPSIPITNELAQQCQVAVKSRIDATAAYTKERVERINDSYRLYDSQIYAATDGKSLEGLFYPETFNVVEDWTDDLYKIFKDLPDEIDMEDDGENLDQFVAKVLPMVAKDETGVNRILTAFKDLFKGLIRDSDTYYFSRRDAIKQLVKHTILNSEFEMKLLDFLFMGLVSGEFCEKDKYSTLEGAKLIQTEDQGFEFEVSKQAKCVFNPIDTRLLIYPKANRRWVIEKINTTFSQLVALCVDMDGEPIDEAPYDLKMLKKVAGYLRERGTKELKETPPSSQVEAGNDTSTDLPQDEESLWDIDGDVTIYECHHIPIVLKAGKMPRKCLITAFNFSKDEESPMLLPIGLRETPYVAGVPYHFLPLFYKDGELSGKSLPELVKDLQRMLNNIFNHSNDLLNLSLWGILVADPSVLKDESKLRQLTPRMILKLKEMRGRDVSQALQWLHPPVENLQSSQPMMAQISQMIDRTSRKGYSGQKLAGKTSATEVSSMVQALQRSINKLSYRLNNLLIGIVDRMYQYTIYNASDYFKLKTRGYKLKNKETSSLSSMDQTANVEKMLQLTANEVYIEGIRFRGTAIDSLDKKAVERQQYLQAFNLIMQSGLMGGNGPQGPTPPHVMQDETGASVQLDEYKVVKNVMDVLDFEDVFKRSPAPQVQSGQAPQGINSPGPQPPGMEASAKPADIAKQANTISGGTAFGA